MKKFCALASIVGALTALPSFGQSGLTAENAARSKEVRQEKDAVSKVLLARHFTPPAQLMGPAGVMYYIGVRTLVTNSLEEVIVAVSRGSNFTVDLNAYRRDKEDSPWVQIDKSIRAPLAKAEQLLREELKKELALEEKAK